MNTRENDPEFNEALRLIEHLVQTLRPVLPPSALDPVNVSGKLIRLAGDFLEKHGRGGPRFE